MIRRTWPASSFSSSRPFHFHVLSFPFLEINHQVVQFRPMRCDGVFCPHVEDWISLIGLLRDHVMIDVEVRFTCFGFVFVSHPIETAHDFLFCPFLRNRRNSASGEAITRKGKGVGS